MHAGSWCGSLRREDAAVAIIKHTNPCGAATGATRAGGIQARAGGRSGVGVRRGDRINREVDAEAAEEIAKLFVEAIIAPSFTAEALGRFAAKKNLRLLEIAAGGADRVGRSGC